MLQAANYTKGLKIKAEKHPRKTQGRFPANWNGTNWQSVQDSIPKVLKIWSSMLGSGRWPAQIPPWSIILIFSRKPAPEKFERQLGRGLSDLLASLQASYFIKSRIRLEQPVVHRLSLRIAKHLHHNAATHHVLEQLVILFFALAQRQLGSRLQPGFSGLAQSSGMALVGRRIHAVMIIFITLARLNNRFLLFFLKCIFSMSTEAARVKKNATSRERPVKNFILFFSPRILCR
jgi:hypothetical protein